MRAAGAEVATVRADVARTDEVAAVLDEIRHRMPPLAGVLHAAGVLDDGILLGLDPQRFTAVMVPKVLGAWNLHALTRDVPLDFFVLFSSIASVLGSPGQGNYAAANAFLDALAAYRHADGLPPLSINWGIWSEVGLAAGAARGGRFAVRGIDSMTPRQGVEVLGHLLRQDGAQIMVAPINWRQFRQLYPAASEMPLLADLVSEEAVVAPAVGHVRGEGGLTRGAVLAAKPEERLSLVENYLRERVAWVFRLPAAQLEVHQPLNNLGLESLMAVELRNQIEADLGVSISMMEFLDGPSVAQLATLLLKKLPAGAAWTPPPGATGDDWEEVRL